MENIEGVNAPLEDRSHIKEIIFAVIILAIAAGAGYMIYQKSTEEPLSGNSSDPVVEMMLQQSSGDDINSLEADLGATDFSGLDE